MVQKKKRKVKKVIIKIPIDLWKELPRNGIYKLYPNNSIEIEGIGSVTNNTREVIRLESGKELPEGVQCQN